MRRNNFSSTTGETGTNPGLRPSPARMAVIISGTVKGTGSATISGQPKRPGALRTDWTPAARLGSDNSERFACSAPNGNGYVGPSGRRGLGVAGMRERLALIGGELEIESSSGVGTTVFARIPLDIARLSA